jgi:hypothetical protein
LFDAGLTMPREFTDWMVAARQAEMGAVGATAAAVATVVVRRLVHQGDTGSLAEPGMDLRLLRTDATVMVALGNDLAAAQRRVHKALVDAMLDGYVLGAQRAAPGLPVSIEVGEAERAEVEGYPIHGYTASEVATHLREALERDIMEAITAPLTGAYDPSRIPGEVEAADARHALRVGSAVAEAWHLGAQIGARAVAALLSGG